LFTPKLEILPRPQRSLWDELRTTPKQFVLYGGTALALRLGHRQSEDFDFFSSQSFISEELLAGLSYLENATAVKLAENTLTCQVQRQGPVLISFFGGLDLRRVQEPDTAPGNGIRVASLADLAGCKAAVIQQRAETKDYLDLAAILKSGMNLETALSAGRAIYGQRFKAEITLRALTSFDEGDLKRLPASVREQLAAVSSVVKLSHLVIPESSAGVCREEGEG